MENQIIYLTRHGETYWNAQKRIQTHTNTPETYLNKNGEVDAARKGKVLFVESDLEQVIHSAKHRARQTAQIIMDHLDSLLSAVEDSQMNDGNLSYFDGMTIEQIKEQYPDIYKAREQDKFNYRLPEKSGYPKTESMKDVLHRVSPLLDEILDSGKTTLLVGHRMVNRVILHYLLDIPENKVPRILIPNEGIYKITMGQQPSVQYNNQDGWKKGLIVGANEL